MQSRDRQGPQVAEWHDVLADIQDRLSDCGRPIVVGIDGRSGVGKSTLSTAIARMDTRVSVIEGDTFYMGGSAAQWDSRSAAENADRLIDWRRQRLVLQQLRLEGVAVWYPFDWHAEDWDADDVPVGHEPVSVSITPIVILEGVYCCRPELHDLLDIRILVVIPEATRLRRLEEREGSMDQDGWGARWSAAEDYYFANIMTPSSFDVVVERT